MGTPGCGVAAAGSGQPGPVPGHPLPLAPEDVASAASQLSGGPWSCAVWTENTWLHATPSGEYCDGPVGRGVDRSVAAEHRATAAAPDAHRRRPVESLGKRLDTRGERHFGRACRGASPRSGATCRGGNGPRRARVSVEDCLAFARAAGEPRRTVDGTHVADLVAANAARVPDQPAVIDVTSANTLTWAQLDEAVSAEADRVADAGVTPGDRVVVRLGAARRSASLCSARLRAGAVVVPHGPDRGGAASSTSSSPTARPTLVVAAGRRRHGPQGAPRPSPPP